MRLFPSRQIKIALTATLLLCLPQTTHAQDYTSNLVGHWTLDETSGTIATDSSSSGIDGTISGLNPATQSIPGQIATAFNFIDGNTNRIIMGDNLDLTGSPLTLSAWINPNSMEDWDAIIDKLTGSGNYRMYLSSSGAIRFGIRASDSTYEEMSTSGSTITTGTWQHVLVTYDNVNTGRIYINGTLAATKTDFSVTRGNTGSSLYIGYTQNNSRWFDGGIDDVRIYDRILTTADITALYAYTGINYTCTNPDGVTGEIQFNDDEKVLQYCNASNWTGIGPKSSLSAGLIGHWTLDETSGASIADSTGSNTGTWTDGVNNDVAEETTIGQNATALSFDGTDDYIVSNSSGSITYPTTFTAWIKTSATSDGVVISYERENSTIGTFGIIINASGTARIASQAGLSNGTGINSTTNVNTGNWVHIAGVMESGNTARIYVNGTLENAGVINAPIAGTSKHYIGAMNASGAGIVKYFNGEIDDPRIYNRSLSTAEIQKLYNSTISSCTPPATNLVAHWNMDETSGASIADTTGTNTGTWTDGANNDVTEETVAGQVNTALSFDETDDIVTVSHDASLDINTAYTVSGWVYFDSSAAASPITPSLISKNNTGGWGSGWVLGRASAGGNIIGGNIRLSVQHDRGISSPNADYSGWVYPVDTWNYVTITWNGNTVNYYLNASLVDTGTITVPPDTGAGDLIVGYGRSNWYNTYHAGRIDDLRIYDSALSLTRIQELYGATGGACTVSNCASPFGVKSEIVFNSDYDVMQYCNGDEWIAMGPQGNGGGGCTNPTGLAAELRYNTDLNILQYCEGDEWISVVSQTGASIPTAGLVAHWALDETNGASIADSAGTNTGTWTDGVNNDVTEETTTGQVGTALSFDATDDLITIPEFPETEGVSAISIATWIKVDSVSDEPGMRNIISKDRSGFLQWNFLRDTGTGNNGQSEIYFETNTSSGSVSTSSTNEWPTDTGWHHVVAVYNGTDMRIYGDGSLINTPAAQTGNINATFDHDICIASEHTGSACSGSWNGDLDDIRIYDRALSASEVQALYFGTQ
ncbi:MAG: LamG domain-containing protein [Alphaproteobacteria bacterium]